MSASPPIDTSHTMQPAEILKLAQSRDPADRERLLLSLVDLCAAGGDKRLDPAIQGLMSSFNRAESRARPIGTVTIAC